jgi:AcrR family transcriptional regulator
MGRQKTISDEAVLRVARDVFRTKGHSATTREIAEAAGISEAILYQRFGSKDDFFFAAMHPTMPDIEELLGPRDPRGNARAYLRAVTVRLGRYYASVIPLALHVMTHPSFDSAILSRTQVRGPALLQRELADRLASLQRRGLIEIKSKETAARLLLSVAHDWALGNVLSSQDPVRHIRELKNLVEVVWTGLRGSKV